MKQKVFFKTFGCRTNIYDTQVMMQNIKDFEIVDDEASADIVVINSCTVTNGADSGARNYINAQNRTGKKVILAGCGALSRGEELLRAKKVFGVLGHSEKEQINTLLHAPSSFMQMGDLHSLDSTIVSDMSSKSKAFIKIQEGCDFRCSYCIIPFVRGDARSQDEAKILEQIKKLAANGFGEFVLSGTNIGSYGKDKNTSLGELLQHISLIKGVRRIRLGSIEPVQIDASFKEILDEPWLERHLHVALQHTSKNMLALMKRRNQVHKDLILFEELAAKGFALGTDFITGHPGETPEVWDEAFATLEKFPLTHIHAFVYSKRDGTPSALLKPQIRGDVAKQRLLQIQALVDAKNYAFRKKNNTILEVLVEELKDDFFVGYDQFYNKIKIKSEADLLKTWLHVKQFDAKEDGNYATY
ncbi:MAG: tRNA (N(6)-L-threonylcarbamoyladenosine(37)-C(2))-methylthiotransferase MtaB [Sulfurospirillum sp.]|nr:tRNA (N(6)-L-threonylcarbamoyladenosine(37)-C(2))-methylthiotransferase MtaB [Sulfurospirillum sp.]